MLRLTQDEFDVLYELLHDQITEIRSNLDDESELETYISNDIYQKLITLRGKS